MGINGDPMLFWVIFAGNSINLIQNWMISSFIWIQGHERVAKLLIKNRVDVNLKNAYGTTALIWAAGNRNSNFAKMLIEKGADINVQDCFQQNALQVAASSGNSRGFHLKRSKFSEVFGFYLFFLIELGQYEIVKMLINHGADVNATDIFGSTPLSFAACQGDFSHFELSQICAITKSF